MSLSEHIDPLFDRFDTWISTLMKDLLTFRYWRGVLRQSSPRSWWKAGIRFCWCIALALVRTVLTLIAIVFNLLFFITTYLQPISALIFLVWDAYDIITIELSNRLVVVDHLQTGAPAALPANPEFGWGFGQILPMMLFLLWVIGFLDALGSTKGLFLHAFHYS